MNTQRTNFAGTRRGASSEAVPDVDPPEFEEEVSRRLWDDYVDRVKSMLEPLRPRTRQEIVLELKTHLLDSIRHDEAEKESERVLNATDRLGRPEEFLEPLVTDRLIEEGSATFNPLRIGKGLARTLSQGLKKTLLGFLFSFGYLLALAITSLGILKPFFPEHVGLFYDREVGLRKVSFAYLDNTEGMVEVLGYWVIPLSLTVGVLMYVGLTKMLVLLRSSE